MAHGGISLDSSFLNPFFYRMKVTVVIDWSISLAVCGAGLGYHCLGYDLRETKCEPSLTTGVIDWV